MNTGMEKICQAMADYLEGRGIPARTAWPMTPRGEKGPVVVVSLRSCQAGPAGFQDYLGERYNQETGLWEECFGKQAELTLGLDIYAPEGGDGQVVRQTFDQLAGALILGGPEGLRAEEFSWEEMDYDSQSRRLRGRVRAVCRVCLQGIAESGGEFVDFELRGVVKQ